VIRARAVMRLRRLKMNVTTIFLLGPWAFD
jgi:hypothetical protein